MSDFDVRIDDSLLAGVDIGISSGVRVADVEQVD